MENSLKFSTYNILYPYEQNNFSFLEKNGKSWDRIPTIAENILKTQSDLCCIQEIGKPALEYLKDKLGSSYEGYYTNHDGNGPGGEAPKRDGVAIFYRKNTFNYLTTRTCAKNQRTSTQRRDMYVDLQDISTLEVIRCVVGHIEGDPKNLKKGDQQLKEILHYIDTPYPQQVYPINTFILGFDLNEDNIPRQDNSDNRLTILKKAGFNTTKTRFLSNESEVGRNRQIDYIFHKAINSQFQLNPECEIDKNLPLASDHRLVSAYLQQSVSNSQATESLQPTPPSSPWTHPPTLEDLKAESSKLEENASQINEEPLSNSQSFPRVPQVQDQEIPVYKKHLSNSESYPQTPQAQEQEMPINGKPLSPIESSSKAPETQDLEISTTKTQVIPPKNKMAPPETQWNRFTHKMSHIFSAYRKWLLPLSFFSLGLVPLAITIFQLFHYMILRSKEN